MRDYLIALILGMTIYMINPSFHNAIRDFFVQAFTQEQQQP